ncbi:SCO family protein [Natronorubrum sulfidifaciens]|uniref:Electron transporter SCO1/SenC n=1 Tax=Natronorubrum sulfidifaciens JCM 14089 TaxID=1230460 RepID=L9W467_9EURY|nr:SCO family protein [Natronorubrum sulfidifaciens]ELY44279.1 electron transporter SCO1/SenC [Natronorubrum sulfidifaciens JCM 14089]
MHRRDVLATGGALTTALVAGCLTERISGDDTAEHAVLEPPENELEYGDDFAYPTYGNAFPSFELPDPLAETVVDTATIEDECFVCTAFYATCPAECIPLMNAMASVQARSLERGISDSVRFLAITFDPERDTPEELSEHADMVGVDLEAGNWHYLRPEDDEEADAVVNEELGIRFQKEGEGPMAEFAHITVTFLVNPDGYVERSYRGEDPDINRISSDLETVVDATN